ncbi:MAG: hypothetical protein DMF06_15000 [Verrucomicrobia bacterium]|nr:MAG: hypothetical protein DMF06_15000 [Verrucomicrobiota bacterium]
MSVARAIVILQDIRARLEDAIGSDGPLEPLARLFADEAEAREAAPERWALEKLDKAIALLRPHIGY